MEDDASVAYLRPETAQGIFVNFKNVQTTTRKKPPFGIAQIGKSFRNEITPGNFIFRTREFEQMEMEYFVPPEDGEKWYEYWVQERYRWYVEHGIPEAMLRIRPHDPDELSHYSVGTSDIEFAYPWGWGELEGIANRTDFDLTQHAKFSGEDLTYFDQENDRHYAPYVIEPAAGADRATLAFLLAAYHEEEVKGEKRTVLRLDRRLAPNQVAVLPLSRNEKLVPLAGDVASVVAPPLHDRRRRRRVDRQALPPPGRSRHAAVRHRRLRLARRCRRDGARPRHDGAGAGPDRRTRRRRCTAASAPPREPTLWTTTTSCSGSTRTRRSTTSAPRTATRRPRSADAGTDEAKADAAALNKAWNVLSDPYQRGRYDQQRADADGYDGDDDGDETTTTKRRPRRKRPARTDGIARTSAAPTRRAPLEADGHAARGHALPVDAPAPRRDVHRPRGAARAVRRQPVPRSCRAREVASPAGVQAARDLTNNQIPKAHKATSAANKAKSTPTRRTPTREVEGRERARHPDREPRDEGRRRGEAGRPQRRSSTTQLTAQNKILPPLQNLVSGDLLPRLVAVCSCRASSAAQTLGKRRSGSVSSGSTARRPAVMDLFRRYALLVFAAYVLSTLLRARSAP